MATKSIRLGEVDRFLGGALRRLDPNETGIWQDQAWWCADGCSAGLGVCNLTGCGVGADLANLVMRAAITPTVVEGVRRGINKDKAEVDRSLDRSRYSFVKYRVLRKWTNIPVTLSKLVWGCGYVAMDTIPGATCLPVNAVFNGGVGGVANAFTVALGGVFIGHALYGQKENRAFEKKLEKRLRALESLRDTGVGNPKSTVLAQLKMGNVLTDGRFVDGGGRTDDKRLFEELRKFLDVSPESLKKGRRDMIVGGVIPSLLEDYAKGIQKELKDQGVDLDIETCKMRLLSVLYKDRGNWEDVITDLVRNVKVEKKKRKLIRRIGKSAVLELAGEYKVGSGTSVYKKAVDEIDTNTHKWELLGFIGFGMIVAATLGALCSVFPFVGLLGAAMILTYIFTGISIGLGVLWVVFDLKYGYLSSMKDGGTERDKKMMLIGCGLALLPLILAGGLFGTGIVGGLAFGLTALTSLTWFLGTLIANHHIKKAKEKDEEKKDDGFLARIREDVDKEGLRELYADFLEHLEKNAKNKK